MDTLMREREAFKRRALAMPTIENKSRKVESKPTKPSSSGAASSGSSKSNADYKTMTAGSGRGFGALGKIVRHMKIRHQQDETHALNLDEMLDETNQLSITSKNKQWLLLEALPNNPKLRQEGDGYVFNPALPCRDKKSLLRYLQNNDIKGMGTTMMDDIVESVPKADRVLKAISEDVIVRTRPDKKQFVYYNDRSIAFTPDEMFVQMWRNASVEGMGDDVIEEYLGKQGIKHRTNVNAGAFKPPNHRRKARKQLPTRLKNNDYLSHILKDYDAGN